MENNESWCLIMHNRKNVKNVKDVENVLSGKDNKRLGQTTPNHQESTAAWNDTDQLQEVSKVSIPSDANVEKAKEWVDNGSRL